MSRLPSLSSSLFSLKLGVAAILALGISFLFDITYPYWAMMSVYIMAQPYSGSLRLKGRHMIIGTMIGAVLGVMVAVVAATTLAGELVLIALLVMGGVLGAHRHRHANFYVYLLAGLTVGVVALPSLTTPDGTFERTVHRVIDIFIAVSSLWAVDLLWPNSGLPVAIGASGQWLEALRAFTVRILRGQRLDHKASAGLVAQTLQMTPLSDGISFEGAGYDWLRSQAMLAISVRGLRTVPLLSALNDLDRQLETGMPLPAEDGLRQRLADWIEAGSPDDASSQALRRELRQGAAGPVADWRQALQANYRRCLRGLYAAWVCLQRDYAQLSGQAPGPVRMPRGARPTPSMFGQVDMGFALRGALSVGIHIALMALLWAAVGWWGVVPGFGLVLSIVFCAAASLPDDPIAVLRGIAQMAGISFVIIIFYIEVVLPAATSFQGLILGLIPALFVLGLQTTKPGGVLWAVLPLAMVQLGPAGPNVTLQLLINFVLSMYIGIGVAILSKILAQNIPLPKLVQRLEQQNLADLDDILDGSAYDAQEYIVRGLDRFLLIQTRLAKLPNFSDEEKTGQQMHILRELRIGAGIGALHRWEYRSVARKTLLQPFWDELRLELRKRLDGNWRQSDDALLQPLDQALRQVLARPEDNHCAARALADLRVIFFHKAWLGLERQA